MTGIIRDRQLWPARSPEDDDKFELAKLGRAVRRQAFLVIVFAIIGAVIAAAMVVGSVQRFVAVESILLDEERSNLLDQVSALPNSQRTDSAIQSEIEIIKSRVLAAKVVDELRLDEDMGFLRPPVDMTSVVIGRIMGLADPILDLISPQAPPPPAQNGEDTAQGQADDAGTAIDTVTAEERLAMEQSRMRERAISIVRGNLFAGRAGRSLVIQIGYEGYDAERTAAIVRAYGDAYTRFQLESTTVDARNAGEWIQQRLDVLERQSLDAARAVQDFRAESNLIEVRGDLLSDQQQSEMTSELITATAETAQARARLENFDTLMAETDGDVIAVSALETGTSSAEILNTMRSEYFEVTRRLESIEALYGPDHPRVDDLRTRAENITDAIADELDSAIAAIRANVAIAQTREDALRAQVAALSSTATGETADLGRLRQLEAISQTYASVYRDYLERYELTTQQQGFPIASVRILTPAEVPRSASSPRKKLMLASGLILGGLIGLAIGGFRELRQQPLRTAEEVQETLGLSCAGLIPNRASLSKSARYEAVMDRTLFRVRQAIVGNSVGDGGCVVGLAPVTDSRDDRTMIPRLCTILAMNDKSVLVIDVDTNARSDWVQEELRDRPRISYCTAQEVNQFMSGDDDPAEDEALRLPPYQKASSLARDYDYVLLLLSPLTRMVTVDPLSQTFNVSILTIPWGEVAPELVDSAMRDHQVFASRLGTTVLENADLRKARRYMRSGDYEERIVHA